jgi:hypothetical protein
VVRRPETVQHGCEQLAVLLGHLRFEGRQVRRGVWGGLLLGRGLRPGEGGLPFFAGIRLVARGLVLCGCYRLVDSGELTLQLGRCGRRFQIDRGGGLAGGGL